MKLRINPYNYLIVMISLFSLSTLTYRITNQYVRVNQIIGAVIVMILLWIFIKTSKKKDLFILLSLLVMSVIGTIIAEDNRMLAIRDALYWVVTAFFVYKLSNQYFLKHLLSAVKIHKRFIKVVLLLNNIILIICLFSKFGYNNSWGQKYFIGFAYSNHIAACGACMCLTLSLFVLSEIKNIILKILILMPATIAVLQTGARTYVISLVVIWILFYTFYIKKFNIKIVLLPAILICAVYIFLNSGMMDKFINPNTYVADTGIDFFTAGRTSFWLIDLKAYWDLNLINRVLGAGFDYPYYINRLYYGYNIWAHNDVINTLLTSGIIGLMIYIYPIWQAFLTILSRRKLFCVTLVMGYYVLIALINGLFIYQHYLYSFILLYVFAYYGENGLSAKDGKKRKT